MMLVAVLCIGVVSGLLYLRVQAKLVRPVNSMFGIVDRVRGCRLGNECVRERK